MSIKSALSQVYFPPTYNEMKGIRGFERLEPGSDIRIGSTRITTYALNHPGGSMAYRLEHSGRVFVFATDHEHKEVPDTGLVEFARGADLHSPWPLATYFCEPICKAMSACANAGAEKARLKTKTTAFVAGIPADASGARRERLS